MAEVAAIEFVVPALDLRNAGVNVTGEVGDEVSNTAIVEAHSTRAAESNGDSVGGAPQLEPRAMGHVQGKGGVEGNGASQKSTRTDN